MIQLPKRISSLADDLNMTTQVHEFVNSLLPSNEVAPPGKLLPKKQQQQQQQTKPQQAASTTSLVGLDIKKLKGSVNDFSARLSHKYRIIYNVHIVKQAKLIPESAVKVIPVPKGFKFVNIVDIRPSDKQNKTK